MSPKYTLEDIYNMVEDLVREPAEFNEWEQGFIDDMARKGEEKETFSPVQHDKIVQLWETHCQ